MTSEKSTEELQRMLDELTIKFVKSSTEADKVKFKSGIEELLKLCTECKL